MDTTNLTINREVHPGNLVTIRDNQVVPTLFSLDNAAGCWLCREKNVWVQDGQITIDYIFVPCRAGSEFFQIQIKEVME